MGQDVTMSAPLMLTERDALIMVDTQVDFCPGGALPVAGGNAVVRVFNRLSPHFATVVATKDWHPADHCSFVAHGGIWPPHCVQGTLGAHYHPDLDTSRVNLHIIKAHTADRESFDNFDGEPELAPALRERGVERVFIGGLATDYCVLNTVLSALRHGFETYAVTDAMRAVEVHPGDGERALVQMRQAGAMLVTSADLLAAP